MNDPHKPLVVYVDVDDTLIRSVGTKRIPIPSTIQQVRELAAQGAKLYCWSSGGADYARASAEEIGIDALFSAFLLNHKYFWTIRRRRRGGGLSSCIRPKVWVKRSQITGRSWSRGKAKKMKVILPGRVKRRERRLS